MREIEFRGKATDNGEWVYGLPVYLNIIREFITHEWVDNCPCGEDDCPEYNEVIGNIYDNPELLGV